MKREVLFRLIERSSGIILLIVGFGEFSNLGQFGQSESATRFPAFGSVETGISCGARVHRPLAPLPDVSHVTVEPNSLTIFKFLIEILRQIGDEKSIEFAIFLSTSGLQRSIIPRAREACVAPIVGGDAASSVPAWVGGAGVDLDLAKLPTAMSLRKITHRLVERRQIRVGSVASRAERQLCMCLHVVHVLKLTLIHLQYWYCTAKILLDST